ncbi:hypothetical protein GCM10023222_09680 [Saccharopolyspora cebuensis]|uniref:PPE family protein n=1 Tax=Saccharopolyspora cebuensis TaxID=418759 RepID=A0ABV4CJS8_9PSEU
MGNWFTDGVDYVSDKVDAVTGAVHDIHASVTGGETNAQEAQRQAREEAAQAARQDQAALTREQRGLEVSGYDPASITQHDNWNDWDQARLASQLKPSLKADRIEAFGLAWEKLGAEVAEVFGDLDSQARAAAGDGMRGEAAEAGFTAAKPLQDWGRSFGDAVKATGLKIREAGVTAGQTEAALVPPPEPSTARAVITGAGSMMTGGMMGTADAALQMRERMEADKQARAIVQNVYGPGYEAVDQSTPTFPPPVNPLNPPPPPPSATDRSSIPGGQQPSALGTSPGGGGSVGSVPGGGGGGGGFSATPNVPAQSSSAWATPPSTPGPGYAPTPGSSTPTPGGPGYGAVGAMPPGGPGGARPGSGAGGGRGPGGAVGVRGGAGGAGGARGLGAGPGAGAAPGAGGRAGIGGAGAAGAGGAAAGGAGGAGGRGGMAGGMGAGAGQRGQGQEDEEHQRPGWLEEQDDVWLDEMPKTAPPVFGA